MSKTVKRNKSKARLIQEPIPVLFAMGYFDIILKLKLSDKDLYKTDSDQKNPESSENPEEQEKEKPIDDKYYHIEDLNTIEDLSFLKDKPELWDKISLSGGNDTLKQLLIGRLISKKKCNIEYFAYNRPLFKDNEEFFSEIFNHVCARHHIMINDYPLEDSARFTLKIILQHKDETNTISIGRSFEEEEKERIKQKRRKKRQQEKMNQMNNPEETEEKEEEKKNDEEDEDEESEDEDDEDDDEEQKPDEYEETEAMKNKKIPKFRRKNSILVKLEPKCDKFSLAYINFVDVKRVPGDFKMSDLLELLKFFKSKGTTLFVNFYKPKRPKIEIEEETIETHENDNEFMEEGKTKTVPTEEVEEEEEPKKEKKIQEGPPRKMRELNELYELTQIYFFDTRQCKKIFNKHYQAFTTDNKINWKKITKANTFDYFIKGIAPATRDEVIGMKTGLFIDQLNKLIIIYTSKKAAYKQEFDSQPHPKINHNNMSLIKEYKDILSEKKNDYYSILLSSIIIHCAVCAPNCQSTDVIYPGFLISLEVIKKKLECEKNHLIPDDNIYKVKIDEKILEKNLEIFASGGRENGFVLDCINRQKSKMKDYVSLYDYHLKTYFTSEAIRKELKNKGFINSKGFIMYDPVHRNIMIEKNKKKKKKITEEEMKNKVMNSINGINVPSNLKDKEIDAKKLAKQKNVPTESKLPINKELISLQNYRKNKKKKKKIDRGSSVGGSSDESDGANSGTDE